MIIQHIRVSHVMVRPRTACGGVARGEAVPAHRM